MKFSAVLLLDAINFFDVIKLTSFEDKNKGVRVIIAASLYPPSFLVDISAKATVLGISAGVMIKISMSSFAFAMEGSLGLFTV